MVFEALVGAEVVGDGVPGSAEVALDVGPGVVALLVGLEV